LPRNRHRSSLVNPLPSSLPTLLTLLPPLSPVNFPPLSNLPKPSTRGFSFRCSSSSTRQTAVVSGPHDPSTITNEAQAYFMNSTAENQKYVTTVQETRSKSPTLNSVPKPNSSILVASVDQNPQNLSILPLKSSSPILTNKAAGPTHSVTLPPPIVTSTETLLLSQAIGPSPSQNPPPLVSISHAHEPPPSPS
ncbi:unnamed protein product, partial [Brassica oleracea var. botrytis]